jgi:CheY-like chemotaxis protein
MSDGDRELMTRMISELNSQVKALIQLQKSQQLLLRSLMREKVKPINKETQKKEDDDIVSLAPTYPLQQFDLNSIHNDVLLSSSPIDYGIYNSSDAQSSSPLNIIKRSLTSLIISEDLPFQSLLANHLISQSITPTIVSSASQALSVLSLSSFDVVLLDITKPGMDGISMAWSIREFDPTIPIISFAPKKETNTELEILKNAGISEILAKPVNLAELSRVLEKYCKLGSSSLGGDCIRKGIYSFNPNGLLPGDNHLI